MTHVIPTANLRAGFQVQPSAPSPANLSKAFDAFTLQRRKSGHFSAAGK
jgi:hypothetical protein